MLSRCILSLALAIAMGAYAPARAEDGKGRLERLRQQGWPVKTIGPIFSQLLASSLPQGFEPVSFEQTKDKFYIRESVLNGESIKNWSQMITITGMKDVASNPQVTPKIVLDRMAEGIKRTCPFAFSTQAISERPIAGSDAAVAVASCGTSTGTAGKTSESVLIAVIKGQVDFYTVQWAERAAPSNTPIPINLKKWTDRFNALGPIKLCPIVPGEKAPYPSCVGDGQKKPA